MLKAKVLGKDYRRRYIHERPNSSMDYQTPAEYASRSTNQSDGDCEPLNPASVAAAGGRGNKVMVKRILNKPGYPPDLEAEAVSVGLVPAELLCSEWGEGR